MFRSLLRTAVVASFLGILTLPVFAQSKDDDYFAEKHAKEAQDKLGAAYSLTKTGFGSADRVTDPGKIYVIRAEGLLSRAVADHVTPTNVLADGKLIPPAKGFIRSIGASGDVEQVNPGDRYYVHEIEVKSDAVVFTLLSLNQEKVVVQGRSTNSRLRMYLKFPIAKGASAPTPEAMHQLSDAIFLPEGDAALTPTVQLGQSQAEVRKIMGEPVKEINLGPKHILVYKDIKVTLVDDKVTDAQ